MRPRVGVAVFIFKENKILFQKRKSSKKLGDNTWSVPGGHLEMFESFENAVKRETFEETGIRIKNLKFFDITNDFYKEINKHYITIFYKAEYLSGTPKVMEPKKCKEVKWILKEEFPKVLFKPIENLLKKYSLNEIYKK
jgi:8-oxo-dGTP diphosphatase